MTKLKSIPAIIQARYNYQCCRMTVWRWRRKFPLPDHADETQVCRWFEAIAQRRNLDVELRRMAKSHLN